jgi:hypothetical protein
MKGDVLGVAAQHLFGQVHHVIQPAGHLHGGNGGDHRHDDQDHVHRECCPACNAENQGQHQHAEAAGKADADAAQARPQPDEKQYHQQFDDPHMNVLL